MKQIEGLKKRFKESKIVYLVTFGSNGEKHSRPMTNFNDTPYETIWFPTYRDTQKVKDIKKNNEVLIIFPASSKDKFYEIKGQAEFADESFTKEKWEWWYLYWHPEMSDMFWFDQIGKHAERVIINVKPISVTLLDKSQVAYISKPYDSVVPKKVP